jgi:hypothetical protein
VLEPGPQLARHGRLLQHSRPGEVVEVVHRVRDVVGEIHDGALHRLQAGADAREGGERLLHIGRLERVGRELLGALDRVGADAARAILSRQLLRGHADPRRARPGVLEGGRAGGRGEVEAGEVAAQGVELGEDAEALGVALEALGKAEPFARHPIQHPLAEMPERRVPEVVRVGRGLRDDRVAPPEPGHDGAGPVVLAPLPPQERGVPRLVARELRGDDPRHGAHLERVGEAVVHHRPHAGLRHDLGHVREPGEVGGEADALEIDAVLLRAAGAGRPAQGVVDRGRAVLGGDVLDVPARLARIAPLRLARFPLVLLRLCGHAPIQPSGVPASRSSRCVV